MEQLTDNMPLFSSELISPVDVSDDYTVRRWVPCADVSRAMVVLDHELIGEALIGAARAMLVGGEIRPTAIYSIGFDTDQFGKLYRKRAEHLNMKTVDLAELGIEKTGNGAELLSFLQNRVLSTIAQDLPQLNTRPALAGFSLSGLFAIQAATQLPHLWGDIAAFSPSLFLDSEAQEGLATVLSQDLSRRVFLAAGALEEDRVQTGLKQHMHELVAEMGARLEVDYGDRVATRIPESATHFSLPFSVMPAMLRHLLGDVETFG